MAARRPPPADPTEAARRKMLAGVLEKDFQRSIIDVCRRLGHLVFHDPDARRCKGCGLLHHDQRVRGFPDLVVVRLPRVGLRGPWLLMVELKTERGVLSTEQKVWGVWLRTVAAMAPDFFYYGVWRPSDAPAAVRLLQEGFTRHDSPTTAPAAATTAAAAAAGEPLRPAGPAGPPGPADAVSTGTAAPDQPAAVRRRRPGRPR